VNKSAPRAWFLKNWRDLREEGIDTVKTEASVTVDRSAEEVWQFITDFAKYPKWDPVIIELRQTSAAPLGVGTTLEVERRYKMIIPERVIEPD